jgi:hypothetical protein
MHIPFHTIRGASGPDAQFACTCADRLPRSTPHFNANPHTDLLSGRFELIGWIEWIAVFTPIFCEIRRFREPLKKHHFQNKKRN